MDTYKTLEELLKDYPQQTLGQGYDYAGQKYNMITLITRISNPNKTGTYWAAQCDCGNYFPAYVPNVVKGRQKSCGCLKHRPRYRDVTGQTFGELTAIRHIDGSAPCKWECRCSCGRTTIVQAGNLFSGHTRSCGHLETEKLLPSKMVDISGQKFGELTPIEPFFHPTRKRVAWHCLCSCGKEYDVVATDLTSGDVISCGHLSQSYSEYHIEQWLQQHNFKYNIEVRLPGLEKLRFDFQIYWDDNHWCLLEFQGEQHFHPVEYFGGEEKFLRQQQYDQQKRDYCQSHNILLYEIRYNEVLEEKLEEYLILSNDYHSGE